MNDIYQHELERETLDKVKEGKVTFLICLNDKNVQTYKEGNLLTLVGSSAKKKVVVKIVRLLYFDSIKELASTISLGKCGYKRGFNLDKLEDEYSGKFKTEKIDKFGFVAIEFVLEK